MPVISPTGQHVIQAVHPYLAARIIIIIPFQE